MIFLAAVLYLAAVGAFKEAFLTVEELKDTQTILEYGTENGGRFFDVFRISVRIKNRGFQRGCPYINPDQILFAIRHISYTLCFSSHAVRRAWIISSTIAAGSSALKIPLVLPVASAPSIIVS
mgnify:CR=1 FL=1